MISLFKKTFENRWLKIKARGGSGVKKTGLAYIKVQPVIVTTFYRITKSSFMTKIWPVKVRGFCSFPYKT